MADWAEGNGRRHGLRVANAQERARATGCGGYLLGLGLEEEALHAVIGTRSDPDLLVIGMVAGVRGWIAGSDRRAHAFRRPGHPDQVFAQARRAWIAAGRAVARTPCPADLRAPLLLAERVEGVDKTSAEDGRPEG